MIFKFLTKPVGQTSEAADAHSHGQILALREARAHMLRVEIAANDFHISADTGSRGVARFVFRRDAINFLKLREINVGPKGVFNSVEVNLVTVGGDLNSPTDAVGAILHELIPPARASTAYQVANAQLRVDINGRPRPNISPADFFLLWLYVAGLGTHKLPNFVALKTPDSKVTHVQVMVFGAGIRKVEEKIDYSVLGNPGHPHGRTDGITFDQCRYHTRFLFQP